MCFSAGASFGAGVLLSGIGIASLKQVKEPVQIPFATIPLIFASQQIIEGFLWLSFTSMPSQILQSSTTYVFLFIAQVIWPWWIPFSILKVEPNLKRKIVLRILLVIGIIVSLYLLYCLLKFNIEAKVLEYHISYEQDYPMMLSKYGGILYVISTVAPALISSIRRMNYLGYSILVSYIISDVFYEGYVVSVWCFFASIISILVYTVMHVLRNTSEKST